MQQSNNTITQDGPTVDTDRMHLCILQQSNKVVAKTEGSCESDNIQLLDMVLLPEQMTSVQHCHSPTMYTCCKQFWNEVEGIYATVRQYNN